MGDPLRTRHGLFSAPPRLYCGSTLGIPSTYEIQVSTHTCSASLSISLSVGLRKSRSNKNDFRYFLSNSTFGHRAADHRRRARWIAVGANAIGVVINFHSHFVSEILWCREEEAWRLRYHMNQVCQPWSSNWSSNCGYAQERLLFKHSPRKNKNGKLDLNNIFD